MLRSADIHAVLFDYGMVLSGPPDPAAWAHLLTLTGYDEARLHAAYWEPRHAYDRGTLTARQYWTRVAGPSPTDGTLDELIAADLELWGQPNPPMVAWAIALQHAGIPTGILSNMGDAMMHGLLARFDWLATFSHHTWSHALKIAKPEAEIYAHAADGLETPPEHILFLDDREENIVAGRLSGMQTLHFSTYDAFVQEMHDRGLSYLLDPTSARV